MMFRKHAFSLRTLISFVMIFSVLVGLLVQQPIILTSRKLLNNKASKPCVDIRELLDIRDAKESVTKVNLKKEREDGQRVPVSVTQPSTREEEFQRNKLVQKEDIAAREQEVADGDEKAEAGTKRNFDIQDGEPFREKKGKQDSLHDNDQERSNVSGQAEKGQTEEGKESESVVELPPGLKPRLAHLQRSLSNPLSAPLEWKRPMMLSALGIPHGKKLLLAMFSAGVNLIGFERSFIVIGCVVGNKTYPKLIVDERSPNRSPHYCLVDPNIPEGATISLLITRNEKLEEAIAKPYVINDFKFEVGEEDLLKLDNKVSIDKNVRELSGGYEIVGIKSNITWHEGLREPKFDPTKKRYEMCLMTAMRQYPFLMQQWFDYYRQMGVDQIFVYDNVSPEDLSKFDSDFVQTSFWPFARSQYQSFNHFLHLSRNRCKYIAFLDADEYIFIGDTKPDALKRYIKKRKEQGYDQIIFPFIVMAGGGHIERPEGLLPNLYVRRDLRQNKFHIGKSIISTDNEYSRHMVHYATGNTNMYLNRTFELNPTSLDHNGMLMHYTRRSWEEFIMKINVGGASVVNNARAPGNFSMDSIPSYYKSNSSTVEYLTFRDHWKTIMGQKELKTISLVWESDGKDCRQQFCIDCSKKGLVDEPVCS